VRPGFADTRDRVPRGRAENGVGPDQRAVEIDRERRDALREAGRELD
jgi:hypothetical protein